MHLLRIGLLQKLDLREYRLGNAEDLKTPSKGRWLSSGDDVNDPGGGGGWQTGKHRIENSFLCVK